jgi:hypothetical protein
VTANIPQKKLHIDLSKRGLSCLPSIPHQQNERLVAKNRAETLIFSTLNARVPIRSGQAFD